jgi:GT2 family glycosyltransferase
VPCPNDEQENSVPCTVWALIVHHRSEQTLSDTVTNLLNEGIEPRRLLVVDNSDLSGMAERLRDLLPKGVLLHSVPNRGFAAAVNAGVKEVQRSSDHVDFLLVGTHEVLAQAGSVRALASALLEDERRKAAGPTLLLSHDARDRVWSCGGYLSPLLRLPRHHSHLESHSDFTKAAVTSRTWLDGALVMYRWSEIMTYPMKEIYFLYLEETDYHLSIGARGGKIVWVPIATSYQHSNGMPVYYAARNTQIFQRSWGRPGFRTIALTWVCAKALAKAVVAGELQKVAIDFGNGLRAGRKALAGR